MLKSRLMTAIKAPFAKRSETPDAAPHDATSITMPEIGVVPDAGPAADVAPVDDLATMEAVAARVAQPEIPDQAPDLTAEEAKFFAAIDDADILQITMALEVMNVNARYGPHGLTPLVHAVTGETVSIPVILALLEKGAETDAPTPLGGNALTAMALGRFDNLSDVETYEVAKAFVALGAGIETPDDHALTPLHRAILRQNAPVLAALLRLGADANAVVDATAKPDFLAGMSPLHAAVMDPELVSLLLKYGADGTALDGAGQTPGAYAADMLEDGLEPEEVDDVTRTLNLLETAQAA